MQTLITKNRPWDRERDGRHDGWQYEANDGPARPLWGCLWWHFSLTLQYHTFKGRKRMKLPRGSTHAFFVVSCRVVSGVRTHQDLRCYFMPRHSNLRFTCRLVRFCVIPQDWFFSGDPRIKNPVEKTLRLLHHGSLLCSNRTVERCRFWSFEP